MIIVRCILVSMEDLVMGMDMADIHVSVRLVTMVAHVSSPSRLVHVVLIHVFMVDHVRHILE